MKAIVEKGYFGVRLHEAAFLRLRRVGAVQSAVVPAGN